MAWKGVIIEESLEGKDTLKLAKIIATTKGTLENEESKGIMHFHKINVEDSKEDAFVNKAKSAIKKGWYIHICKGATMIVIFNNKAFKFTEKQQDKIDQAKDYGLSLGIKMEQMTFEDMISDPYA